MFVNPYNQETGGISHSRINIPHKVRPNFIQRPSRSPHTTIAGRTFLDNTIPAVENEIASSEGEFKIDFGVTGDEVTGAGCINRFRARDVGVNFGDLTQRHRDIGV